MAIASFPNGIKPTSMVVTSEFQTVVTNSHSFARQSRTRGGQRWKIDYTYPPMTRSQISPLLGFLQAQNGRSGEFEIDPATSLFTNTGGTMLASSIVPITYYDSTPVGGGIAVARETGAAAFSAVTDKIEAGTFIKFSNHPKVYMTTQALEISSTGAFFQSATLVVESKRDTNSPKLSGDLLIGLPAINVTNSSDDSAAVTVTVATLAADTAIQVAIKIASAINAISAQGFSASSANATVTINVAAKSGGTAGGRKVHVPTLINTFSNGITGIRSSVDQFAVIGGVSPAALYFDPPLREAIDSTTDILIAPLNSIPFNVALKDDSWSTNIDEIELYNGFKLTFIETF
tara:strand:- start:129 stop:1169 length:1041 start_codon:yes stop_codon:yes gene_type:complete